MEWSGAKRIATSPELQKISTLEAQPFTMNMSTRLARCLSFLGSLSFSLSRNEQFCLAHVSLRVWHAFWLGREGALWTRFTTQQRRQTVCQNCSPNRGCDSEQNRRSFFKDIKRGKRSCSPLRSGKRETATKIAIVTVVVDVRSGGDEEEYVRYMVKRPDNRKVR